MTVIISINEFGTKHNFHISGINEGNNETYYKDFGFLGKIKHESPF